MPQNNNNSGPVLERGRGWANVLVLLLIALVPSAARAFQPETKGIVDLVSKSLPQGILSAFVALTPGLLAFAGLAMAARIATKNNRSNGIVQQPGKVKRIAHDMLGWVGIVVIVAATVHMMAEGLNPLAGVVLAGSGRLMVMLGSSIRHRRGLSILCAIGALGGTAVAVSYMLPAQVMQDFKVGLPILEVLFGALLLGIQHWIQGNLRKGMAVGTRFRTPVGTQSFAGTARTAWVLALITGVVAANVGQWGYNLQNVGDKLKFLIHDPAGALVQSNFGPVLLQVLVLVVVYAISRAGLREVKVKGLALTPDLAVAWMMVGVIAGLILDSALGGASVNGNIVAGCGVTLVCAMLAAPLSRCSRQQSELRYVANGVRKFFGFATVVELLNKVVLLVEGFVATMDERLPDRALRLGELRDIRDRRRQVLDDAAEALKAKLDEDATADVSQLMASVNEARENWALANGTYETRNDRYTSVVNAVAHAKRLLELLEQALVHAQAMLDARQGRPVAPVQATPPAPVQVTTQPQRVRGLNGVPNHWVFDSDRSVSTVFLNGEVFEVPGDLESMDELDVEVHDMRLGYHGDLVQLWEAQMAAIQSASPDISEVTPLLTQQPAALDPALGGTVQVQPGTGDGIEETPLTPTSTRAVPVPDPLGDTLDLTGVLQPRNPHQGAGSEAESTTGIRRHTVPRHGGRGRRHGGPRPPVS